MRLFFAVNFSEREKDVLEKNVASLKKLCVRGNFTQRDNLHITLAFLGEVDRARLGELKDAMNAVTAAPFELSVRGAGNFGDIVWLGVDEGGADGLSKLASALRAECDRRGVYYDKKPFSPHLTICRGAVFNDGLYTKSLEGAMAPLDVRVGSFELMESTRINGKLTYKKIFSKKL